MFTGFVKCDCNGICVEVNPFICTTTTSSSTTTTTSSSTTTTTTTACNRWGYYYASYTCNTCEFIEYSFLYNSNPLTLDLYYQYGDLVITPYEFTGCDAGVSDASIPNVGVPTCEEIVCTTTTTTTAAPRLCSIFGIQGLTGGGSWGATGCLGGTESGSIDEGATIFTPCIDVDTLVLINAEVKSEIPCE